VKQRTAKLGESVLEITHTRLTVRTAGFCVAEIALFVLVVVILFSCIKTRTEMVFVNFTGCISRLRCQEQAHNKRDEGGEV
jgi:hypothetical protein